MVGLAAPVVSACLAAILAASHANADNLIRNGDFEKGCVPSATCSEWTLIPPNSAVTKEHHDVGKYSVLVGGHGSTGGAKQRVELKHHIYSFSFWYKSDRVDNRAKTPLIVRIRTRTVFAAMVEQETNWTPYQIPVQVDGNGLTEVHILLRTLPIMLAPALSYMTSI
ncbi:hypothetical protein [Rhizobium leguminosarum]|uniref:hypothetical protein n=1 Tax=Rhizobium leguminosarum TaxID=384 RepID=UPI001C91C46B|nr:hypothetical protein [Rhizobium leguminosarum]MBY2987510.1 hypothetical protein [Rhizobium leguminosarum]